MEGRAIYVMEVAELFPPQGKWTESAYFALPDTNRVVELSDGVLIMPPAPTMGHQLASRALFRALDDFVVNNSLGEVLYAPVAVRLRKGTIREPDVLFLRSDHLGRMKQLYIDGPPDWIAEVISQGTRNIDEVDKLREYAQAGVPEYWLVDLEAKTIRVYVLRGNEYTLASTSSEGEIVCSETISGFEIPASRILAG